MSRAPAEPGAVAALVLVDHGSRRESANAQLEAAAERVRARRPELFVEIAHMEIVGPKLVDAVERCVEHGATEIVIHPYFLAPGRHAMVDIPEHVRAAAAAHPDVRITVSDPLGLHDKLIDVVLERYDDARNEPEGD